ncbi:esterase [Kineosporia sp. NBRC 101677]|uniref:alpha/beta hydrolase fold domain-containing protein n=1 Tax=Kineosporia sp. NBRC 101677 TaxID=3032197 RepID=UPI0024A11A16|nr:alpha/beta hydrolase fold domain-containing protein [Kineosporia sp. NBRC 101677]GLY17031.1 esterase [Kineosporia sp. NBRC 101677]
MTIQERRIEGPHGEIPLRIYSPGGPSTGTTEGLGLVWLHGGGFAAGDLDMPENDWVARQLAQRGVRVVTVDYRLVPMPQAVSSRWTGEPPQADRTRPNHFPVASEEVTAAWVWAVNHDTARTWALGGASAGANLAAGAALRLRDRGGPAPRALLLVYPVVHAELPPLSAELRAKAEALPEEAVFGPETVRAMNLNYVEDPAQLDQPYAFPGGHELSGLPPTFVLNSDHDTLRASGEQFGAELAAAGVDVTVIREPGARHGHLNTPDEPEAQRSITRIGDWLTSPTLLGRAHERN